MPEYNEQLKCEVVDLHYFFETRTGEITFAKDNCCDMSGCIKLFKTIDSKVRVIQTYSGENRDTRYKLYGTDTWRAS